MRRRGFLRTSTSCRRARCARSWTGAEMDAALHGEARLSARRIVALGPGQRGAVHAGPGPAHQRLLHLGGPGGGGGNRARACACSATGCANRAQVMEDWNFQSRLAYGRAVSALFIRRAGHGQDHGGAGRGKRPGPGPLPRGPEPDPATNTSARRRRTWARSLTRPRAAAASSSSTRRTRSLPSARRSPTAGTSTPTRRPPSSCRRSRSSTGW